MMKKSTQILAVIKKTKEGFLCICLSVILTVSVYRTGKSYYTEVLLEECKYVVQEKKIPEYITDGTEISSDDSDEENSDEKTSNEEN